MRHDLVQVIDIQEEKRIQREAEGLVELHDFIKAHPDTPVKEIAKFMPPVDSRAVSKAIQILAMRDKDLTPEQKKEMEEKISAVDGRTKKLDWGI